MKNLMGAPNMVWGMYILISLNRIYKIRLSPHKISALPGWISIQTGTRLVIDALRGKFGDMDYHDPRVQTVIQMAKSMELVKSNPGKVRENIFLFNNSGNAQKILAENFMKGANSGVASSLYIHGNRIYSYGPHFPIAQRNDDGTILIRHPSKKAPSKTTAGHISAVVNAARAVFSPDSILYDTAGELSAEAKGPAAYSNPGVRKNARFLFNPKEPKGKVRENIFLFNNPRELNSVESAAAKVGLVVGTWAPGDGITRYRFFLADGKSSYGDYHQGDGLYTALGRKDALAFISAYGKGKSAQTKSLPMYVIDGFTYQGRRGQTKRYAEFRTASLEEARSRAEQIFKETGVIVSIVQKNPLTRSEAGYLLRHAKADVTEAGYARRHGLVGEQKYHTGRARGIGFAVQETGPKAARKTWVDMHTRLDRTLRNPCSNPITRGDKLPARLQDEALRRYVYRWTTGNTQRGRAYGYCPHCKTQGGKPSKTNVACRQVHPTIPLISDVEWLKTHAFHITKDGRFSEKHNHAEPGYMADTEDGALPNPLLQTVMMANPGSVKTFNEMQDVGKAKYVVNYHDGVKVHRDGSPFFDIAIFSSRTKKDQFVRKLESLGFTRGTLRNPPISQQWDSLTGRQRLQVLGFVGFDETASRYVRLPWKLLSDMVKQALEQYWNDTSSSRGTTRRRLAPVGANPLTRREAGQVLRDARFDVRYGSNFQGGHTRSSRAGMAWAKAKVVRQYGPRVARRAASKIADRSREMARTAISNPGSVRLPKPGTKLTVAQALDLAQRIGDRGLIEQCQKALKLQKVANKNAKCVIWKTFPMGSSDKIDSVVALTHYGDSPETMYQPPKGSKKGNHMYRHKWGETGGKRSVPLLASADGKMLLMPLEGKKVASDWLRH